MKVVSMSKYAPRNDEGLAPYLREAYSWGRSTYGIVWAATLPEAKREHGYTRMQHTTIRLRRATPEDMAEHGT